MSKPGGFKAPTMQPVKQQNTTQQEKLFRLCCYVPDSVRGRLRAYCGLKNVQMQVVAEYAITQLLTTLEEIEANKHNPSASRDVNGVSLDALLAEWEAKGEERSIQVKEQTEALMRKKKTKTD